MGSIGEMLRGERLRQGVTLKDVAEATKIGSHYLECIEANRFDLLPGGLFTRSFLRQYTRVLKLDEAQVVASFNEQFPEPEPEPPCPPVSKRSFRDLPLLPGVGWLTLSVLCCAAIFGMWQNVHRAKSEPALSARRQFTSEQKQATVTDSGPALPSVTASTEPTGHAESRANSLTTVDSAAHPTGTTVLRAVFTAKENVWIAIESDGNRTFTGILQEHQSTETTAGGKIFARVGNSGGVDVSINGKSLGPIGEHGQVRLLEVTPTGTRIVAPTTASPSNQ